VPWQLASTSTKDLERLDRSLSARLPRGRRPQEDERRPDGDKVGPRS
jgi:hypothetical protein